MAKDFHIMVVASAGGHWVQLMRLRPAWAGLPVTYVTTDPGLKDVVARYEGASTNAALRFHTVTEGNRWQKRLLIKQLIQLTLLIARTRPSVIMTTGAAPGYFALRIGKFFGARTIWIDSMANAEELSLSGRKIKRHADVALTQWEHLAQDDGPLHWGSVL